MNFLNPHVDLHLLKAKDWLTLATSVQVFHLKLKKKLTFSIRFIYVILKQTMHEKRIHVVAYVDDMEKKIKAFVNVIDSQEKKHLSMIKRKSKRWISLCEEKDTLDSSSLIRWRGFISLQSNYKIKFHLCLWSEKTFLYFCISCDYILFHFSHLMANLYLKVEFSNITILFREKFMLLSENAPNLQSIGSVYNANKQ